MADLATKIRAAASTKRLTISGGEPLDQLSSVIALVQQLCDFDIAIYTGFEIDEVPTDLLRRVAWIKVGAFDVARRTTVVPFIGSTNQRFLNAHEALTTRHEGVQP